MLTKTCTKCKENKDIALFSKLVRAYDGLQQRCKTCKAEIDREYREAKKQSGYTFEEKQRACDKAKRYREAHPDRVRARKREYYSSDIGKACKRREELAYRASGGRAETERRRAEKPLSDARLAAKEVYRVKRYAMEKEMPIFDKFCLDEAKVLCKLRGQLTGIKWHTDHIVPISKGGTSAASNIQVVPAKWNHIKANKLVGRYFNINEVVV